MKKFIITLLCLAIIAGGSYGGYLKFQQNKDEKRIVDVVSVSMLNQEYFNEEKTTEARVTSGSIQNVELSTQNLMKEVCVKLGDKVKKGDTLLIYDMTVVELENEKNKNMIAVIEQEIKEQEQELKRLQSLQPSENAPKTETTTKTERVTTTTKKTTTKTTTTKKTSTTTTTAMIRPVNPTTTTAATTKRTTTKKPEPQPVSVRSSLTTTEGPDSYELDGSLGFRCTSSTVITAEFMQQIIDNGEHVILYVYDSEHKRIQYFWVLDGSGETKLEAYEWHAGDGVSSKYGSFVYDGSADGKCGMFVVYVPEENETSDDGDDGYDDYDDFGDDGGDVDFGGDGEDIDIPDVTQPPAETEPPVDTDPVEIDGDGDEEIDLGDGDKDRVIDAKDLKDDEGDDGVEIVDGDDEKDDKDKKEDKKNEDENYKYTRAELVDMIKEAQLDLKEKQLELRKADLQYKAGLKQKEDGRVIAQIDGVVTRLDDETTSFGAAMEGDEGEYSEYEDYVDFEEAGDTDFLDDEDMGIDHPYIVIQGKANVSLDINVPELSLSKFEKGTVVSGISYNTGQEFTAVVTGRKDDPVSYRSYGDDNPNSSTYVVTADVTDCPSLAIDQYVTITIPDNDNRKKANKNALNIPVSYLRKDGASYYVMLADENGLLKKRFVKTGKIYYGITIEVLSGLTLEDRICFPYGKDVKEGVKTRETDEVVW